MKRRHVLSLCMTACVVAFVACSSSSTPARDAGDAGVDSVTDASPDSAPDTGLAPNPLVPENPLYPFPSDYFLVADSSLPSGRRLAIPQALLPPGFKVADLAGVDGFSRIPSILSYLPGGVALASLPTPEVTITAASPALLVEEGTFKLVPLLVENDATAKNDSERALILRPLIALAPAKGYVVILRDGLTTPAGKPHVANDAFKALRDGTASSDPAVEAQREAFKLVSGVIEQLKLDKSKVVLAWSFHTRSKALIDDLVQMQDLANAAAIGSYTIKSDTHDTNNRQIVATFAAPNFLDADGRLTRDAGGKVVQTGTRDVEFSITIPDTVTEPRPAFFWGHGFLGHWNQSTGGLVNDIAQKARYSTLGTFFGMSQEELANTTAALLMRRFGLLHKVSDSVRQNLANTTALFRLLKEKLAGEFTHTTTAGATIKPFDGAMHYAGGSNGGTFGYVAAVTSPQIERAAIAVGGGGLSHFLERAVQWNDFGPTMEGYYPDALVRQSVLSVVQLLMDPIDSMNYAEHLVHDRLPGRKPLKAAVIMAANDSQVRNLITEWVARTAKIPLVTLAPKTIFGLETITAAPPDGANAPGVLFVYDEQVEPSPTTNLPPAKDNGTHGSVGKLPTLQQQIIELFDNGKLVQFCDGACDPN